MLRLNRLPQTVHSKVYVGPELLDGFGSRERDGARVAAGMLKLGAIAGPRTRSSGGVAKGPDTVSSMAKCGRKT